MGTSGNFSRMLTLEEIDRIDNGDLLDKLTKEEITEVIKNIDQDRNGSIDWSEFLAYSLSEEQLSEANCRTFFNAMIPSSDENTTDGTIDAWLIQRFFMKCGKHIRIDRLNELINDCGQKLNIPEMNAEAKIEFTTFYKFMTSVLDKTQ